MDTDTGARQRSRAADRSYRIRIARPDELDVVLGLIDHAADWLRENKDTTQWATPWPHPDGRMKRVHDALVNGETWLLFDGQDAIGTVSIKLAGHEELWTPEERETEAVYLHRLVIDRDHAGIGLGAELIDWAARKGASRLRHAELVRIDVWTDNHALHEYYCRQGFKDVDVRETSDRTPSGALFQRAISTTPQTEPQRIIEHDAT
ncbi:GNAT family N-acetyltransferase [Actinomadura monticuli]|uniref:GNAT family N-acetyltransferase n=1 Tax=Actinomadura monticuli TaxID=3097367 RepID=A0ABV4Q9Y8_9ACTN